MARHDSALLDPAGWRRLYKAAEDTIGPHVPRPLRQAWRRLIGRPPLPGRLPPRPPPSPSPAAPKRFDVVCFPIIAWSFRFQRPQQLLRELARCDHRVFWIDPDAVKEGSAAGHRTELAHDVFEVRLAGASPRDPFREALTGDDLDLLLAGLRELQRDAGLAAVVAIVQLPFWAALARRAATELGWTIVYDCMDDHAAFSTNDEPMLEGESWLIHHSSLVVTTSQRLGERVSPDARRIVSIPNACDYEHFSPAARPLPRPAALDGLRGPIIGYIGAISEWFDFDLLRHAVSARPDWSFVLVGSTWGARDHSDLAAAANVRFLGEQPYDELPALLAAFDVACIPFLLTPLIEATDPVKLYEYFAAGKPVVASRLPELEAHADHVSLVDTPGEFTGAIAEALAEDPRHRSARTAFARRNTWRDRARALEHAIEETFAPASVCVVTWNNLDLTRACLESVLADRTWPETEVVVVDNASSDETGEYLRALASRDTRVRIILNDDNRGFAAANNQALRAVTGRYVALLNNDTVVPRGWLARLIRVLEGDHQIGLVGPVTDGVWNEARVDGITVTADEVDAFAAAWARDHAGRVFSIGMLAMYCVVARREVIDLVGPLDERFGIGMFEDDDYAHRVRRAGFRLACAEEVFVHHAGQASFDKLRRKDALWEENRIKFEEKWGVRWRAPGIGTRARIAAHREEVDRLLAETALPPVVWLPGERRENSALADAFGFRGHPVIEVRDPASAPTAQRIERLTPNLLVSTLPLEAFDSLRDAIVLPCAARAFDSPYFPRSRMIYVDEPDAPAAARRDLRSRATIVIAAGSPVDVESVLAALP